MRYHAIVLAALSTLGVVGFVGCKSDKSQDTKVVLPPRYTAEPRRSVPEWLKGSIFEEVDLSAIDPYRVSNFGLVVLKQPTGDARNIPNSVREYMLREMTKHGIGGPTSIGGRNSASPDQILQDPHVAIVRVDAFIPAGAAENQRIDVQVSALENSDTTSLAGGKLFLTDLYRDGANLVNPGAGIDLMANARGYVFVNPAYALEGGGDDPVKRRSLTTGLILDGGRTAKPRPLILRIRSAERRLSRMTEQRINQLFSDSNTAHALDEGTVAVNVPEKFRGDWEHFAGVVLHTFWIDNDSFAAAKAIALVEEAQKPDALLLDISYTWEALGRPALGAIQPLYTNPRGDIAFAAARAGAFIGDSAAESALAAMAANPQNPFRINAVKTLVALQPSPAINALLRELVTLPDTLVRIEAYRGLARNKDTAVTTWDIGVDKFKLDIVENDGPPLVYATRSGTPRIAFIGGHTRLPTPTFFSAMQDQLTISPIEQRSDVLSVFYRGAGSADPIQMLTRPDLADLVSRLGGGVNADQPTGEKRFDFTYGEIVALLSRFSDQHLLLSTASTDQPSTFVLQDPPAVAREIDSAPVIPDGPRPISDAR